MNHQIASTSNLSKEHETLSDFDYDVIIVGAGLSGLTAAYYLTKSQLKVKVLEARSSRIGGRINSIPVQNHRASVDLGPAWIWPDHNPNIMKIIKEFDELRYFPQYQDGDHVIISKCSPSQRRVRGVTGHENSYRIEGGTYSLVNALHKRLPANTVEMDQFVTKIQQLPKEKKLSIETNNNLWTAFFVIVAIPPQLAATSIQYEPLLPSKLTRAMLSTQTWMGHAMKVALVYPSPFWRVSNLSGMAVSHDQSLPVQQFHDASPRDGSFGALFGWVSDHHRIRFQMSKDERKQAILNQVEELFGSKAAHPLQYEEFDWSKDTLTSVVGSPDILEEGDSTYGNRLLQTPQMEGCLWWAGTEVSQVNGGYLDGAIHIGQSVANSILKRINSSKLI